jgi:ATP-dependent Clp protease protease subunit
MKNRLRQLFSANAKRGTFRAKADAGGNVIELYDVIVSSEDDAAWFGGVSLQAFRQALAGMTGTVHLRINSPGGDVFAGIAMAQLMREYKGEIICHVDGYAASAASLVAIAGAKCIMAPGSMLMIHKAWTFAIGNSDDLLETADLLDKIDGQLAETYASKTGNKSRRISRIDGEGDLVLATRGD